MNKIEFAKLAAVSVNDVTAAMAGNGDPDEARRLRELAGFYGYAPFCRPETYAEILLQKFEDLTGSKKAGFRVLRRLAGQVIRFPSHETIDAMVVALNKEEDRQKLAVAIPSAAVARARRLECQSR